MNTREYARCVREAHIARQDQHENVLWLSACLMQEAGELAEHIIKYVGYNKDYTVDSIVSEAGDVLNFLTAILNAHNLTLKDVMVDNVKKLKRRGWLL